VKKSATSSQSWLEPFPSNGTIEDTILTFWNTLNQLNLLSIFQNCTCPSPWNNSLHLSRIFCYNSHINLKMPKFWGTNFRRPNSSLRTSQKKEEGILYIYPALIAYAKKCDPIKVWFNINRIKNILRYIYCNKYSHINKNYDKFW